MKNRREFLNFQLFMIEKLYTFTRAVNYFHLLNKVPKLYRSIIIIKNFNVRTL